MPIQNIHNIDLSKLDSQAVFFLDTNILYFIHSGYYAPTKTECVIYSSFVQHLLTKNSQICVSILNIQELLFGIENQEYYLYLDANSLSKHSFTKKDFRNDSVQRLAVKNKLSVVMKELESTYTIVDGSITASLAKRFIDDFTSHHYDPIDYFLVQNAQKSNKTIMFVTDDKDFQFDPRINIITK